MKVVIVNEAVAYPPRAGNWLRTVNLMVPLAERHDVTYLCRAAADPESTDRARSFYESKGITPVITPDPPPENMGGSVYLHAAANLLSPLPYSIASHRSPLLRREIARLAATAKVDLWQFEALSYADMLHGTKARTLVMAHNVESLIWQRLTETESNRARRWYIRHQWRKYERYEERVLRGAGRVVVVSEADKTLMRERFGITNTSVVDNGVDVAYFADGVERSHVDQRQVLFLGALNWRPNLDGVDLLVNDIMPRVLEAEPGARLCIVGRNPPPALVRRLRALPHVDFHADVPDVRPYLARAGMLAVPLRIGGGSRLKILEAAAAGLPVVSSRIGCEGLILEAGRDLSVVETELEMADAIVDGMRNPARAIAAANNAKRVIERHYDWKRLANQLETVWEECGSAGTASPIA